VERFSSGSPYEAASGYSRAVVANGLVFVSATAALSSEGLIVGKGDFYAQTRAILEKIAITLKRAGSSLNSVVQTRIYTVDVSQWQEIGRAHAEAFAHQRPALSLVHVQPFLDPEILVEIELIGAVEAHE